MVLKTTNKMLLEEELWKLWMEPALAWMRETSNLLLSMELGDECKNAQMTSFGWESQKEITPNNSQLQFGPICLRERTSKTLHLLEATHSLEPLASPKQRTKLNRYPDTTVTSTLNKRLPGLNSEKPKEPILILATLMYLKMSLPQTLLTWGKESSTGAKLCHQPMVLEPSELLSKD